MSFECDKNFDTRILIIEFNAPNDYLPRQYGRELIVILDSMHKR